MKKIRFTLLIALGLISSPIYSQQKQHTMTNQEVVEKFLAGFNDPSKIQESLALLADDYQFTNPMVQLQSKAEFVALAQEMGQILTGVNLIRSSEDGDWVATLYEFRSSVPGLESNIATEWFKVEDSIIQESRLIYDASKWRVVYEQMEE
jgi:predicted SnoaL-like aldol condensation-catalyzing enzyme